MSTETEKLPAQGNNWGTLVFDARGNVVKSNLTTFLKAVNYTAEDEKNLMVLILKTIEESTKLLENKDSLLETIQRKIYFPAPRKNSQ
jgi:ribosomal protein L1